MRFLYNLKNKIMINLKTLLKFFTILEIIILGCGSSQELKDENLQNNEYYFYYYENINNELIMSAYPLILGDGLTIENVLDSITSVLTRHFQSVSNISSINKLSFEFKHMESLKTEYKTYEIAVINIIDPLEICMKYFFQGSSGGQTTFNTLGTNLLQPNIENHPLVDGVIILYNGIPMQALDHINLSGVMVPRFFEDAAFHAKIRDGN